MIKVMHVIHGLNTGGAEKIVSDYALYINKKMFNIIILCFDHYKQCPYENKLTKQGIKIICLSDYMKYYNKKGILFRLINHVQKYYLVKKIIHSEAPDIIHTHLPINKYIKFAKPNENTRIYHTIHGDPQRYYQIDKRDFSASKWLVNKYKMRFLCLHDDMKNQINRIFNVDNSIVVNNGINLDSFKKSLPSSVIKKELNIKNDAFVVGHVGRFEKVKNHEFLVDVFSEIHKTNSKAFLLMIGSGKEQKNIEQKLQDLGLMNSYMILSNRDDIPNLLNAMNVFIFPSKSEGLGIALIEAQEAKLPCFISNAIPDNAIISNLVLKMKLNINPDIWAKKILEYKVPSKICINDEEWDVKKVVQKVEKIYLNME